MSRILILSSQVAVGHVGLSAAGPVLERLGHRVTGLPTVLLSNHPGFAAVGGGPVQPERLTSMIDAMDANGWLHGFDTLLTGYLPSPDHVRLACNLIARLRHRSPEIRVVVDPVLGDHPAGLYIDAGAAAAVRDTLLPLADVATPNLFELGWLSGRPTGSLAETLTAARSLDPARVVVTSPPLEPGQTGALDVCETARLVRASRLQDVPHGVGDVLSGLVSGGLPLGAAMGHLQALVRESTGQPHLDIAGAASIWTKAAPLEAENL